MAGQSDAHLALYEKVVSAALTQSARQRFIELLRKQTLALEEGRPVRRDEPKSAG